MRKHRRYAIVLCGLILLLVLCACASNMPQKTTTTPEWPVQLIGRSLYLNGVEIPLKNETMDRITGSAPGHVWLEEESQRNVLQVLTGCWEATQPVAIDLLNDVGGFSDKSFEPSIDEVLTILEAGPAREFHVEIRNDGVICNGKKYTTADSDITVRYCKTFLDPPVAPMETHLLQDEPPRLWGEEVIQISSDDFLILYSRDGLFYIAEKEPEDQYRIYYSAALGS